MAERRTEIARERRRQTGGGGRKCEAVRETWRETISENPLTQMQQNSGDG